MRRHLQAILLVNAVLVIVTAIPGQGRGPRQNQEHRGDQCSLQGGAPKQLRRQQNLSRRSRVWRRTADHGRCGRRHRQEFPRPGREARLHRCIPAAPNDQLFFEGGERIFPEFLKQILADYKIQGNKFHIARAVVNGGISAFYVASLNPDYFAVDHCVPRVSVEGNSGARPGHLQNVHQHVCRGTRPNGLAAPDAEADGRVSRQRDDPRTTPSKRPASSSLNTLAGPNAGRLFDLFEQSKNGCGK